MDAFLCVDVWGTSGEMTKFLAALVSGRAKGKALIRWIADLGRLA